MSRFSKIFAALVIFFGSVLLGVASANAAEVIPSFSTDVKMKWNAKDQEITSLIEQFAKESKTTFVVDPAVRGRISIFAAQPVTLDEAFDLLGTALAQNGFTVVPREGRYVVMAARNAQRSSIPTLTEITSVKPERYVTLIMTLKHITVGDVYKNLRVFPSKDGEMTPLSDSNQLIITDYISNVNRIAEMLKLLDQPMAPSMAKIIKESKAQHSQDVAESQARRKLEAKADAQPVAPKTEKK